MAGPNQDIVGRAFEIVSDKTQIEAGESVSFLVSYIEQRVEEGDINLYINNNFIESIPFGPSPISFDYVFRESGTFSLYVTQTNVQESNEVVITVNDIFVQPQGLVSWRINNKTVSSLEMNNKEIQSIVTSDGVVLYNIDSLGYNAISLSSDKNILSYADSESCTLSAQLTNSGSPVSVSDVSVEFFNGSTSLGSALTDSNGIATKVYSATGGGDVVFTAVSDDIHSTSVTVEDCYKFDPLTSNKNLFSVASGSATINYSNDGVTITGTTSTETHIVGDFTLPEFDYEITYDVNAITTASDGYTLHSCFEDLLLGHNNNGFYARKVSVSGDIWGGGGSYNPPCTMKLEVSGTTTKTIAVYRNNSQIKTTLTGINQTGVMQFISHANGRGLTLKNLKIKPLPIEYDGITLTSDENILSYVDGDTCTLTAQLTDNGSPSPVEGETVSFYNGATLLGTDDTDSNGIATLTYTSAGVGDMTLTASVDGIIVSETFSIRDFTYIADTMEKLATALTNVTTGNSIYLKDGTYSLPSSYTVSGIKLIGESTNAKIVSSDGQINFTDSIVDTIGMETANVNRPVIYVDGTTTVKNCDCISNLKPWDAAVISVNLNNPNGLITIYGCYFHGNAQSNGFGHSCAAITGQGSVAYNVIIHHNTFNHPCNSGQLHGSDKGKAVCFYNGGSTTGTLNNVHLYCNEYLGCGDTNITVSEEICPDN